MKRLFFMLFIYLFFTYQLAGAKIGVFDFIDNSGYKGKWTISRNIPQLLVDKLNSAKYSTYYIKGTLTLEKELLKKELMKYTNLINCDLYIMGKIKKFSVSQIGLMSVGIGGYTRYSGEVVIDYYLINKKDYTQKLITVKKKVVDNNLGLTFLGGPGVDDISETLLERLNRVPFGSEQFFKTVIGKAVSQNIKEIIKKIKSNFSIPANTVPRIVQIEKNKYVYVNIGKLDNVKKGDRFVVFEEGDNIYDPSTHILLGKAVNDIAVVEISLVISDKLSKAKIVKILNNSILKPGMKLRKKRK